MNTTCTPRPSLSSPSALLSIPPGAVGGLSRAYRPHRRRPRVIAAVAVGLSAALALSACGGDDTTGQDDHTPAETVNLDARPDNVAWDSLSVTGGTGAATGPTPSEAVSAGQTGVVVKVPRADQGPKEQGTYGSASGFEFSPVGAGLAAMNAPLRVAFAPEDHWDEAVSAGIAPGEGRDELLTNRAALQSTGTVDPEYLPTLAGWVVTDYLDAEGNPASSNEQGRSATVEVYATYSDDSISKTTYQVVRSGGDWKVELPGEVASVDELADNLVEVNPDV